MPSKYDTIKDNYPIEKKSVLFASLGGQWPSLVEDENYENTCAIRLSIALRKSGYEISDVGREAIDNEGNAITLKVATMSKVVRSLFGESTWGLSRQPGAPFDPSVIPEDSGIIVYHAAWKNATGHFDLWTGNSFYGAGNFSDLEKSAYDVEFWKIS